MLNSILAKIAYIYALYSTRLYCLFENKNHKPHIDYDILGVAKVSTIQKVELERDTEEVFFVQDRTRLITERFDRGYYARHGMIVSTEGEVLLHTFRAYQTSDFGDKTTRVSMNREQYDTFKEYRQDEARIVYPDGRVILDKAFIGQVIRGERSATPTAIDEKSSFQKPILDLDSIRNPNDENEDCAGDETYALSAN